MKTKITRASRLKNLSDAIFAIVLTLLVLDLKLPNLPDSMSNRDLIEHLQSIFPIFQAYILSFLIIFKYWQHHNRIFSEIYYVDTVLTWSTALFLLSISALPLPSNLLGKFGNQISVILFDISVSLPAFFLFVTLRYFLSHPELLKKQEAKPEKEKDKKYMYSLLFIPTVAMISVLVSFIDNSIALYPWVLVLLRRYFISNILGKAPNPY